MRANISIFIKLLLISFKSQLQHRASFFMLSTSHFLSTFVDIFSIWVLFERFKMIEGWTLEELALIYGIVHMGFALSECFARGFDTFSQIVKNAEFDRLLLRPLGTLLQVATREFQIMRVGRFLQGLTVLLWSSHALKISLISMKGLIIAFAVLGTTSLFYGLFVIQATVAFWTTETLELLNITTYGGLEAGQYPMSLYNRGFKLFFTFIIPLACVAFYPISSVLHKSAIPIWLGFLFPLAGIAFLFFTCKLWKLGVRRYHSAGN